MADPILSLRRILLAEGHAQGHPLSGDLAPGARVRLQAPVGHASTPFLRTCVGLLPPAAGDLWFRGLPFRPWAFEHPAVARGELGWAPTGGGLLANLDLLANVTLPLRWVRRLSRGEASDRARQWLDTAGLLEQASLRPDGLEARDRWLGGLARAAALNPTLLVIDQPPGELDRHREAAARTLVQAGLADDQAALLVADAPGGWASVLASQTWHLDGEHLDSRGTP